LSDLESYQIRLAQAEDQPRLRVIEIESAKRFGGLGLIDHLPIESMSADKLSDLIDKQQVWVIGQAKELIGFAAVSVWRNSAYLEEMDVMPEHGNRGLGTKLVKTVCDWATERQLPALVLSTFESVAWNAPFYRRLGFTVIADECLSLEMQQIKDKEREAGLPVEERVFMQLEL
jgi:GNAT superfamily N-acetyltransferase